MSSNTNRISQEKLLYIAFFLILITQIRCIQIFKFATTIIGILLLILSTFQAFYYIYLKQKKPFILLWILCYILLFFCYRTSGQRETLDLFIYSSVLSNHNVKKVNNHFLKVMSLSIIVVIILAIFKIIPSAPIIYRNESIRYSLGFSHPNTLGFLLFLIASSLFIKYYSTRKNIVLFPLILLQTICLFINKSRMCGILISVICIIYLFNLIGFNKLKYILNTKILKLIITFSLIACLFISIYLVKNYYRPWIIYLDAWSHGRIINAAAFIQKYPITLCGNKTVPDFTTNIEGWGAVYLDIGFLYCLIRKGTINTFFYIFIMMRNLCNAMRKKDYAIIIVLLLLIISLFFESSALTWFYAFPLLFYFEADSVLQNIMKGVLRYR